MAYNPLCKWGDSIDTSGYNPSHKPFTTVRCTPLRIAKNESIQWIEKWPVDHKS